MVTFHSSRSKEDPNSAPPESSGLLRRPADAAVKPPQRNLGSLERNVPEDNVCFRFLILSFTSVIISNLVMKNVVLFLSKSSFHF